MARFDNEVFENRTVLIDGNEYVGCEFTTCTIEFRATARPQLINCHFAGCRWSFNGPAADTIRFLTALYSNGDPVLQAVVDQTLANVRTGVLPDLRPTEKRPPALAE
jgi:hypothetical protein